MSILRQIEQQIENDFFKGKIIVLLGARQVGKSTLIKMLPSCNQYSTLWLDGENADVHLLLKDANSERLKQLTGNHKVVVIDEAQKIEREKLEREKNLKHTKDINQQALKAFVDNGFSEDDAKKIITLIAKKSIPFITINY